MPQRQLRLADRSDSVDVRAAFRALQAELSLPDVFPALVLAEASSVAEESSAATWPVTGLGARVDLRDLPFVTIDPPGSMDLDQAVYLERSGTGYTVHYAIADLGAFIRPGGALDAEARARGTTLYGPDDRIPLHPPVLSEGAASLLPDVDRPAAAWRVELDAEGEITSVEVRRAVVRSRRRWTYAEAQEALDAGTAPDLLELLRSVGTLRQERERARGGVSLQVPEQEIVVEPDGSFSIVLRETQPVEEWNAHISLLTGIAAAQIMREGGVGVLRTLPEADPRDLARLRRTAKALRIDWPQEDSYGDVLARRDHSRPRDAAFLAEATSLFRGASYVAFGGVGQEAGVPDGARHAAIAAEYAHVTAPLRRLVDRYGTEACLALCAGEPVPGWVLEALPTLPQVMAAAGRKSGSYDRAVLDIVEAALLTGRVGEDFPGVVVDVDDRPRGPEQTQRGQIMVTDPAVRAQIVAASLPLGEVVSATLTEASMSERRVRFTLAEPLTEGGPAAG